MIFLYFNRFKIDLFNFHSFIADISTKWNAQRTLEFADIKDKTDPNNLVYSFETSGNESKDFRNYQMPLKLFKD